MIQIAPSILSADFLHLEKDVETVNRYADILHFDVMDGVFVPNISFGFPVIEAVARKAEAIIGRESFIKTLKIDPSVKFCISNTPILKFVQLICYKNNNQIIACFEFLEN